MECIISQIVSFEKTNSLEMTLNGLSFGTVYNFESPLEDIRSKMYLLTHIPLINFIIEGFYSS